MRRIVISILILSLGAIIIACSPSQPVVSPPPPAPVEVLSVWKSPPSPQGFPPFISQDFVLGKYGSEGNYLTTQEFFLQNGQWIDVILRAKNIPVRFYDEKPGEVCFRVGFLYSDSSFGLDLEDVGGYPGQDPNPFIGKILYAWQETRTGSDTIYSIAIRLFAEGECRDGNWLGSHCHLHFTNFNIHKTAEISYEVYKLATTPKWGILYGEYYKNVLLPWFTRQGVVDPTYSSPKVDQMWKEWLEQFRCG